MSIDNTDFFIWPTTFSCVIILEDIILPNEYNLTIGMIPDNRSGATAVGLRKVKQFISKFVQNSIVINCNNQFLSQLSKLKSNTIQLPDDPHDYFFAAVLFHKLSAITQDYFAISHISIDSNVGDHVKYQINNSCNVYNELLEIDSWWTKDNVNTNNYDTFPSWESLDINVSKFSPKLVKGGKDENKSARGSNT